MTTARVTALAASAVVAFVACGGKVDGGSLGPSPTSTTTSLPPSPGPPVGTPLPPPPTSIVSPAADKMATYLADAYCTAFAACCGASGQPPIDVVTCRAITKASVLPTLSLMKQDPNQAEMSTCITAVTDRVAACSALDYPWGAGNNHPALLGPYSIKQACAPLLGTFVGPAPETCSAAKTCASAPICLIDECGGGLLGASCQTDPCIDGVACVNKVCVNAPDVPLNGTCKEHEDCHLGLVCLGNRCLTARANPNAYTERHSPYRVSAETCRVFTTL